MVNLKYGLLPLAAMASAALPEVKFVRLAEPQQADNDFLSTGLVDERNGRWVVTCPRTKHAGIQLETQAAAMSVLSEYSSQLPFKIARPAGFARFHQSARALVHPALPGKTIYSSDLVYPTEFASNFGTAIACLHNIPQVAASKANLPIFTRTEIRNRWLIKLSRAQQQMEIPTALQQRWEVALSNNELWHFSPKFVHGSLNFEYIFKDNQNITGIGGLGQAHFGDPALDLAWVNANASAEFMKQFLESYDRAGGECSASLLERIDFTGELVLLDWLLHGVSEKNEDIIADAKLLINQLYEALLIDGKIQLPTVSDSPPQNSVLIEKTNEDTVANEETDVTETVLSVEAIQSNTEFDSKSSTKLVSESTHSPLDTTTILPENTSNIEEATIPTDKENGNLSNKTKFSDTDSSISAKIQDHLKTTPIEKTEMQEEANRSYWD